VACPPIVGPCFYGIDMSTFGELFAPEHLQRSYRGRLSEAGAAAPASAVTAAGLAALGAFESVKISKEKRMEREKMAFSEHFDLVMDALRTRGLLLGSYDAAGKPNAMAIGWGSLGNVWSMPLWIVLVRPSRYTYQCIEHSGCFSVNVPGAKLESAVNLCGTKSGRDGDKFAEAGLTAEKGRAALAPTIAECPIVYECQVVHRNDVQPGELVRELQEGPYANGDYHRVYFGKIVAAAAAPNPAKLLG